MSRMDLLNRRRGAPNPAQSFGAPEADAWGEPEAAPARPKAGVFRQAGAMWKGLRDRISGGEDPSFDEPGYRPPAESGPYIPDFDNGPDGGGQSYAEESPADYGYGYYAQPQAPVWEPPADTAFYGGYPPRETAPAAEGEPRPDESGEFRYERESAPSRMVRPVRTKKKRAGDLGYTFWSCGIVLGMLLTVASFIYGCVI